MNHPRSSLGYCSHVFSVAVAVVVSPACSLSLVLSLFLVAALVFATVILVAALVFAMVVLVTALVFATVIGYYESDIFICVFSFLCKL